MALMIGDVEGAVLDAVRDVVTEVNPSCHAMITLDSVLERELGLDSLARAELMLRVEQSLHLRLADSVVATAETPRDVVSAALHAPRILPEIRPGEDLRREPVATAVPDARTLVEALEWHASSHPERIHVQLLSEEAAAATPLTYGALRDRGRAVADGLASADVRPGDNVALMLPTSVEYFVAFFGVLMAGATPVPVYPPVRTAQLEDYLRRQIGILDNAQATALVTIVEAKRLARVVRQQVASLRTVITVEELEREPRAEVRPPVRAGDTALLQYTSGSTGAPKGVVLTHADLLANIRAMADAARVDGNDIFASWLPLYHDMGLIGAWLGSLVVGFPLVVMPPLSFLARPGRWLRVISDYRATLTGAPNFGFELCARKVTDDELRGVDLSSLRMAFNGAEPVSPETLDRFQARFAPYGLRPDALAPVYGLAEAAVGLAFPPPGRSPVTDRIERGTLSGSGRAVPAELDHTAVLRVVACGQPLPGYEIRIVDAAGDVLGERREGRVEFRGPSATSGYFRNEEATKQLFDGDWLDTGDLGYLAAGDVYLTGRAKDLIIRAGRNLHPEELENAIDTLPGIRTGCVAVFSTPDPDLGTERLVVAAETRVSEATALDELRASVVAATVDVLGTPPDDVVLLRPRTLPKTSSGKIRRTAARDRYQGGQLEARARRPRIELARLALEGLRARARTVRHAFAGLVYATYAWFLLAALALPVAVLVLLLPRRSWRFAVVRGAGRLLARLAGIRLEVSGLEHVPARGAAVIVANHASYIDGLVLAGVLPRAPVFVVSAELARKAWSAPVLRRLGVEFVERATPQQGAADTGRVIAAARAGNVVVVFPEGRLSRVPGLRPFGLGAFVTASEVRASVIPVAIRGTRSVVPPGHRFPRRCPIDVVMFAPTRAHQPGWAGAVELERAARQIVLAGCGEPDIA